MSVCLCNARIAPILASIYPQPAPPLPPVSVVSPIVSLTRNIYRSHGHLQFRVSTKFHSYILPLYGLLRIFKHPGGGSE